MNRMNRQGYLELMMKHGEPHVLVTVRIECQHCSHQVEEHGDTLVDAQNNLAVHAADRGWFFGKLDSEMYSSVFSCLCGGCHDEIVIAETANALTTRREELKKLTGTV